jgi:hypothetical protein
VTDAIQKSFKHGNRTDSYRLSGILTQHVTTEPKLYVVFKCKIQVLAHTKHAFFRKS